MDDKLNRRTLGKTAGALAGGAMAARFAPAVAQDATPETEPVEMEMVEEIVADWPDVPRELSQEMMDLYGPPHEATPSRITWFESAPWKRTVLYRDEIPHDFPMPHPDVLEQFIDYQVPPDMFDDLAQYTGSLIVERTKGEMSARCDKVEANFLSINLANDIVTGELSVDEARERYGEIMMAFMEEGQSDPYIEGFVFDLPEEDTRDPDEPVM